MMAVAVTVVTVISSAMTEVTKQAAVSTCSTCRHARMQVLFRLSFYHSSGDLVAMREWGD